MSVQLPGARLAQIYAVAARLFIEKGVAATSMNDIAEAVGITKAGLYHFVPSKEELLKSLIVRAYEIYDRDVDRPARRIADPLQRLHFIIRNHLYNVGRHRTETQNPVTILLDDPAAVTPSTASLLVKRKRKYYALLRDTLDALEKRGQLADIDPTVAAFSLVGMILWLARWHRTGGRLSLDEIVTQMTAFAMRAVIPPGVLDVTGILLHGTEPNIIARSSTPHSESAPRSSRNRTTAQITDNASERVATKKAAGKTRNSR